MQKHIGLVYEVEAFNKAREKCEPRLFMKELRNFIHYDYTFPKEPEAFEVVREVKTTSNAPIAFHLETIEILNNYTDQMKRMGVKRANRSLLFRHIISQFNEKRSVIRQPKKDKLRSNYILEKGTSDIMAKLVAVGDFTHVLENFLLEEYQERPIEKNIQEVVETERKQLQFAKETIHILNKAAKTLNTTKSAVVRDAINQYVTKATNEPFINYLTEYRLREALKTHTKLFGKEKTLDVINKLSDSGMGNQ